MKKATIWIILGIIVGVVALFMLTDRTPVETPATGGNVTPDGTPFRGPTERPPSAPTVQAREITVRGNEFTFSPESIRATRGDLVRITFANDGAAPHAYDIDELDLHTGTVSPGQSDTLEFTVPEELVTYQSYCSIPGHRERGMVGTLVIEL